MYMFFQLGHICELPWWCPPTAFLARFNGWLFAMLAVRSPIKASVVHVRRRLDCEPIVPSRLPINCPRLWGNIIFSIAIHYSAHMQG